MWSEVLISYGVFLLEIFTVFALFALLVVIILSMRNKPTSPSGELKITNLGELYREREKQLTTFRLTESHQKAIEKEKKQAQKEKTKLDKQQAKGKIPIKLNPCLYVLNFTGDSNARATSNLREEISAILAAADAEDEVLLRLESPGGVVHGYGLAASQLTRLKEKGIKLTVAVDKVAASGGYMMASVADKIVSAPFAIVGSVGVVAQIPNIHRFLKKHDVDVDIMTAGEYKRTMTILGENTEKGKAKFIEELEETHQLFKEFVGHNRPQVDLDKVATGEHWYGQQAIELQLVDEISTSDDLIQKAITEKDVLEVKFVERKSAIQKIGSQVEDSSANLVNRFMSKSQNPHL